MITALLQEFRLQHFPVQAVVRAGLAEGFVDALFHALQAAQIHVSVVVAQQARHLVGTCTDQVLGLLPGLLWNT